MLKNDGRVSLLLKLGSRICVCLPNNRLNRTLREKVRPLIIGGLACWCDRSGQGDSGDKPARPHGLGHQS